ncbi:MAG TPA: hypothetical protein VFQ14_05375 [Thermoleophilaceae bacterium]|nr:hypothetical protein [Thermoleophilaceae bacterium]
MLLKILYWLAVLVVSLVLVVALIVFLEHRDQSSVDGAWKRPSAVAAVT